MKLLLLKMILALSMNCDMGNIGRYEIEVHTKNGTRFNANFTVATYDKLKSEFKSNYEFKDFIFNTSAIKHLDSLRLFKKFYYINYPKYSQRSEKLTAVLKEDWITVAKSDIEAIGFKSLKMIDYIALATQLNLPEIRLLRTKPVFINMYSIDAHQEGYSNLWLLSYNPKIKSEALNKLVHDFKAQYEGKTQKGEHDKNSWVYQEMITNWQKELKEKKVYLIEIINP